MANLFPSSQGKDRADRPGTPPKGVNNFTTPVSTPQGSPSKKTIPPGANELPAAFENAMKLDLSTPLKLGRPQSIITPLSPGKTNVLNAEEASVLEDSILHKNATAAGGSALKRQGQENTPPTARPTIEPPPQFQMNHAALSRHEFYQHKDRPSTPVKRFNTQRGLTEEEREILKKPNVKRLVNVTQLCK